MGRWSDEDDESFVEEDSSEAEALAPEVPAPRAIGGREKTIEERYTKLSQLEHILARPDAYVGSLILETTQAWTWSREEERMVFRTVNYVPAMLNIFDEIIVNAADVKAREMHEGGRSRGQKMTKIDVTVDTARNCISVLNDGQGIPVEIHKEHQMYVPELIFGHLLTSDNYDDTDARVTGGRNGYGAKLTNIFSTRFEVEVIDSTRKKRFRKQWRKNMTECDPPDITPCTLKADSVKVTFYPDLKRFKRPNLEDDLVSLMEKRVYDAAGTTGVKVSLNGRRLTEVKDFRSYVELYFLKPKADRQAVSEIGGSSSEAVSIIDDDGDSDFDAPGPKKKKVAKPPGSNNITTTDGIVRIYERANERWEVVISQSDGQFQQVSFVNSICTTKGGTHVNHVVEPLVQAILKKVTAKNKGGIEIKGHHVRNHIFIFVNCLIVNPSFDTQTKETMTLRASMFGSACTLSEKTINAVVKSPITESVLLWAQAKQQVDLKRMMKTAGATKAGRDRILGIPKLEDANDAGTRHAGECTLILTEGDSAKTSCIAGLSVVGRDRYGVFPLRGKVLNVRDATFKQLKENKEVQNILSITGLEVGKKFLDARGLRYGSIMIMTDQDHDGSHIKGLLINMLQHYWPDLLKCPGFLKEFVTPIVKVSKKDQTISFFTIPEYEAWKRSIGQDAAKAWRVKYYKGLGTSDNQEFAEYFADLQRHQLNFKYVDENDFEAIDMAFNSKRAEDRKAWIQSFEEGTFVDHRANELRYRDFVNKELVLFSRYDLERSIPNIMDGWKPAQRKALFGTIKRGLFNKEMKVAQLAAYVANVSCYHHGEESMAQTIVGMAQTFVGSNNLNVLVPCGQFGSRKEGGKDASATRYIYTKLSAVARALFLSDDEALLHYNNEEGRVIEPRWYVPVIPLILVNGTEGIGTGWSSSIPAYNPKEITQNIRRYLKAEPLVPMDPWYLGFTGRIEACTKTGSKSSYESVGNISVLDEETIMITELPVKVWTQGYKEFLEELLQAGLEVDAAAGAAKAKAKPKAKSKAKAKAKASAGAPAPRVRQYAINITDYRDNSTHETIAFTIRMEPDQLAIAESEGLEKVFKLRKPISTSNMTLFDHTGKIVRYESELEILREFCQVRLEYYHRRRRYQLTLKEKELALISNKLKFVLMVVEGELVVHKKKKTLLVEELDRIGFDRMSYLMKKYDTTNPTMLADLSEEGLVVDEPVEEEPATDEPQEVRNKANDYDYLLSMPIWNLTYEKVEDLKKLQGTKEHELERYRSLKAEDLWLADLDAVDAAVEQHEADLAAQTAAREKQSARVRGGAGRNRQPATTLKALPKKRGTAKAKAASGTVKAKKEAPAQLKKEGTSSAQSSPNRDFALVSQLRQRLAAAKENKSVTQTSTLDSLFGQLSETVKSMTVPAPVAEPMQEPMGEVPSLVPTVSGSSSGKKRSIPSSGPKGEMKTSKRLRPARQSNSSDSSEPPSYRGEVAEPEKSKGRTDAVKRTTKKRVLDDFIVSEEEEDEVDDEDDEELDIDDDEDSDDDEVESLSDDEDE